MNIFIGIETSCDDTAIAFVDKNKKIYSHIKQTQIEHAKYGGVFPSIAVRNHEEALPIVFDEAFDLAIKNGININNISGIAVTQGPGLVGSLITGLSFSQGLVIGLNEKIKKDIPIYGINHLKAHALVSRLENDIDFPFLTLLISGGNTLLFWIKGLNSFIKFL